MKKVLLLNPPGKKLYIRDYYCSKVSQADYIYHPVDLLYVSGFLKDDFELKFVDCIVKKISVKKLLEIVKFFKPNYIIMLIGSVSLIEDLQIIKEIKFLDKEIKIIVSGDLFRENPKEFLIQYKDIDAILFDFFSEGIFYYLKSEYKKVKDLVYKLDGEIVDTISESASKTNLVVPIPKHELFITLPYRYPFVKSKNFATILSAYGCPFNCIFCIISNLPYKLRNIDNIIEEIRYIKSLGIDEIFFLDQTFAAVRKHYYELCETIISEKLEIKWFCFSRVDVVDEELLLLMKKSGCHTIIFGVESADDDMLNNYRKGYNSQQVVEIINLCNKIGIDTVGTFILGLPEETKQSIEKTLKLIKKLPLDYASFNVAVPRVGTQLRKEAIEKKLVNENFKIMDQSGSFVAMPTKNLTKEDVLKYRKLMVLNFYFRLSYILRRIKKLKSFRDLLINLKQFLWLVRNTFL